MTSWRERLGPGTLGLWDRLLATAQSALPGAGIPDGSTVPELVGVTLQVAEAKGLCRFEWGGEQIRLSPRGEAILADISALGSGDVSRWAEAIRAVAGAAAHPDPGAYFAELDAATAVPEPGALVYLDSSQGRRLWPLVCELEARVDAGVQRAVVRGPGGGGGLGLAWFPSGDASALSGLGLKPDEAGEWEGPDGARILYVPTALLAVVLMVGCTERGLLRLMDSDTGTVPVATQGNDHLHAVLDTLHPAWEGDVDWSGISVLLSQLMARPAPLEQ